MKSQRSIQRAGFENVGVVAAGATSTDAEWAGSGGLCGAAAAAAAAAAQPGAGVPSAAGAGGLGGPPWPPAVGHRLRGPRAHPAACACAAAH
jgi:hypothetical protein